MVERGDQKQPSLDRFAELWQRVNEHKLVQWTVGYVAVAYAIQHAVILTSESFEWPNVIARSSMLLLILGLPFAITFAWYHGARASRQVSKAEMSIISILLVIGTFLFYSFARPPQEAGSAPTVREAGVTAARQAAADPHGAISVAVMPFANLSGDKDQEYFSDGMTDEISGALAKIPDLRVVARSSAYEFKGKDQDARALGKSLGATHLIEGSVRKAGDQLRISAELVKADDGVTVWSSSYDRQLKDVFAIQEDIARAIAASFHMALGLKPGESLISARPVNPESHEDYLHARSLIRSCDLSDATEAIRVLEKIVVRDPDYAAAWGLLCSAHHAALLADLRLAFTPAAEASAIVREHQSKGLDAAERAIKADPKDVDALIALANLRFNAGSRIAGGDLMEQALMLDPDNPEALHSYSVELSDLGFEARAVTMRERLLKIEPYVPNYKTVSARILFAAGQNEAAMNLVGGANTPAKLNILAAEGRFPEVADALASVAKTVLSRNREAAQAAQTASLLIRNAPSNAPQPRPDLGALSFLYVYLGAPDEVLAPYEKGLQIGFVGIAATKGFEWAPTYAATRKTERFKKYARDSGMLAYWRAKGWPPQCHSTTGDDFECG